MPHKEWERHYAFLNEIQLQDPFAVIYACATGDTVFKDRQLLFELFYAALGSEVFADYDAELMREYILCWERTITMVEACHRMAELKRNKQFHYSYSGDVTPK